ncbi:MAG: MBL fold metallo-hydrolase [Oscillospiraceae bacterium]|nr:MBL fold metallo-hydrolase [Oscillospiraceae bacterium]
MNGDIVGVGVQDLDIRLFEGQFFTPKGMAYNSYLIKDKKTAVMDSVERSFAGAWLENIDRALGGAKPDYLIVQHMEPDHSGSIADFMARYPQAVIVSSVKAFSMMQAFYGSEWPERRVLVKEGDALSLGKHALRFIAAPMVHWPEVLMTLDETTGTLFSADAFGRFGAGEGESDACVMSEARRYYFGIVGKFGAQVRNVLKKLSGAEINVICPLHGTVLEGDLSPWLNAYSTWADYAPESEGVAIAFTSVYGNTRKAVELLASMLAERGCPKTVVTDLTDADQSRAVAEAFRFGKLVLASTTYNGEVFPAMRSFIEKLAERNYQKRTVALIENGSWAPMAAKTMKALLEGGRELAFAEPTVRIMSALSDDSRAQLEQLADALCR